MVRGKGVRIFWVDTTVWGDTKVLTTIIICRIYAGGSKIACAHLHSLIRVFAVPWRCFWSLATHKIPCEDSDQTARMLMLIWVFAGHTCSFVGNASLGGLGGSVGCESIWWSGGDGFDHRRVRQHSFVEIDHEIFSTAILSLSLIQEGNFLFLAKDCVQIQVNLLED